MRKRFFFAYAKTKTQISFAVTAKLISAFVFATWIVQFLFYLNPKFQASSHLLWLYSPVCIGPGRKPRRPVFSERGSYDTVAKRFPPTFRYGPPTRTENRVTVENLSSRVSWQVGLDLGSISSLIKT